MPSLNLDLNYPNHPKTKRLIALAGPRADIFPVRLWCYAGSYFRDDGVFRGHSDLEVEALAGWDGKPGELVSALLQIGFLVRMHKHLKINDWREHEGHLVTYHQRAKQAAKTRWQGSSLKHSSSNREAMPLQCSSVHSSSVQTPTPSGGRFSALWATFPKRLGRDKAKAHFDATVKTDADLALITQALQNYLGHIKRNHIAYEFIAQGKNWFAEWRDWIDFKGAAQAKPPAPKLPEPIPPEPTEEELKAFHDAKLTMLKVCKTKNCRYCGKPNDAKSNLPGV